MRTLRWAVIALAGCGGAAEETVGEDASVDDVAAVDAGPIDAGFAFVSRDVSAEVGPTDVVARDVGMDVVARDVAMDAGFGDVSARDVMDAGLRDAGARDVAMDAGFRDIGPRDLGVMDTGPRDAGLIPVPRPADVRAGEECHALIRRLGVRFTVAGATRGIVDPITVTPPIEGVHYRYASWTAAERPLLMDCRLAVALVRLGRELTSRWGIDDVQHIGIYNYRTVAGSSMLSQHAYATAIDIGAFRGRDGTTYSVLTDFTMNGAPTCPPRSTNARDRALKEIACWMNSSRTFHIVLTPNYNAAHRNHYHVDLTTGSNFIQAERPGGVDPPHDPLLDWLIDDE